MTFSCDSCEIHGLRANKQIFQSFYHLLFIGVISHDEGQTQPFDQVKCKFIKINAFSISYSTRYVTSNRKIRCIQCCHVQFSKIDSFPWIHDTIKWYNTFYRRINLAHLQRIHHRYPIRFISLWFQFGLWTVGINKKNDNLKFTAICDERKKLLLKLYIELHLFSRVIVHLFIGMSTFLSSPHENHSNCTRFCKINIQTSETIFITFWHFIEHIFRIDKGGGGVWINKRQPFLYTEKKRCRFTQPRFEECENTTKVVKIWTISLSL